MKPPPFGANRRIIWLASYPKSGNTWLRLALSSLMAGGAMIDINTNRPHPFGIASNRLNFDTYLDIDSADLTDAEITRLRPHLYQAIAATSDHKLVLKAHDCWAQTIDGLALFPPSASLGAILVLRDPRDVVISLAHHLNRDLDWCIDLMADPHAQFAASSHDIKTQVIHQIGSWSRHTASWLDQSDLPVIRVHYEEMLADLPGVLRRIAAMFALPDDSAALAGAVAATRFETLQAQERTAGFRERPPHMAAFFRDGRSGGWRTQLSLHQTRRLEQDHAMMMNRLGYVCDYSAAR